MVFGKRRNEQLVEEPCDLSDDDNPKMIHSQGTQGTQGIQATKQAIAYEPQGDDAKPNSKSKTLLFEMIHFAHAEDKTGKAKL